MRPIAFVGLTVVLLSTACFDPKVPSGGVTCGPAEVCPAGLVCRASSEFTEGLCCDPADPTCAGRIA